mgnify:FL=1
MENIPVVDEFVEKINPPKKWPKIVKTILVIVLITAMSAAGAAYFYRLYHIDNVFPGINLVNYV